MDNDTVICVEGLGKRYEIGRALRHDTLRDRIVQGFASASARLRGKAADLETEPFWALRDVAFEVRRGEVLGVVGRNGAGKSTLLKILSRITEPTTGAVSLRGRVASLLEVGTGFHPELTGRENILLNGSILGMSRTEIRARFDEIVEFAEVSRFLDTAVKHYSSGMYVRLAFSIAAHLEPEILIIDEVLAVGDVAFQKKCLGKMREVSSSGGRTVLFVSHNLPVVRQVCTRALLLQQGRLTANGSTHQVLNAYAQGMSDSPSTEVPEPTAEQRAGAFVCEVRMEDGFGKPLAFARVGEPWRIRLRLRVARSMPDFIVAVGSTTSEGIALQTAWSPSARIEPGDYEYLFIQDSVAMAADSYNLIVGLSTEGRSLQQFNAARLEVSGESPMTPCVATSGYGLVVNSMRIESRRL